MTRLQIVVSLLGPQSSWNVQQLSDDQLQKLFALAEKLMAIDASRPQSK